MAISAVGVEVALIFVDVLLVLIAILAVGGEIPLIFVDVALIGVAIDAIFRQVFPVLTNVLLVALDVLRRGVLSRISAAGQKASESECEDTTPQSRTCVHFS